MFAPSMLLVYAGLLMFLAFVFIAAVATAVLLFRKMRKPKDEASDKAVAVQAKAVGKNLFEGIDFSDGISNEELELIRSRAIEAANQQFQNMALKKIRALLQ